METIVFGTNKYFNLCHYISNTLGNDVAQCVKAPVVMNVATDNDIATIPLSIVEKTVEFDEYYQMEFIGSVTKRFNFTMPKTTFDAL